MASLLDVRGLPPCEPFERIMSALDELPLGASLEVLIHREPFPLYDWLRAHHFSWDVERTGEDEDFHLHIRHSQA